MAKYTPIYNKTLLWASCFPGGTGSPNHKQPIGHRKPKPKTAYVSIVFFTCEVFLFDVIRTTDSLKYDGVPTTDGHHTPAIVIIISMGFLCNGFLRGD